MNKNNIARDIARSIFTRRAKSTTEQLAITNDDKQAARHLIENLQDSEPFLFDLLSDAVVYSDSAYESMRATSATIEVHFLEAHYVVFLEFDELTESEKNEIEEMAIQHIHSLFQLYNSTEKLEADS